MESSILSTFNVLDLGVERVISKAISPEHGTVLKRIGAEVVFPEKDRAVRLAKSLTCSKIMHSIDISEEYDICEMEVTHKLSGKTVRQLDLRSHYGLNLIAITNDSQTIIEISPDTMLIEGSKIVVIGRKENIDRLTKHL
jgi:trk system potassium uptake protein TrkA